MTRIRMALLLGGLLALALAVGACGGGGKNSGVASLGGSGKPTATTRAGGAGNDQQRALAYARCMRQHGVDMPDPTFDAQGHMAQRLPSGVGPDDPKFTAADQACKQYAPSGAPDKPNPQEQRQMLAYARCMRQHGINNLPDPRITANGIDQPLPRRMDQNDPRLKAAEQACHQYGSLGPPKPGGPQKVGVASEHAGDAHAGAALGADGLGPSPAAWSRPAGTPLPSAPP